MYNHSGLLSKTALSGAIPELAVIVPTYCEADNLPELIRRISASIEEHEIGSEIVVVDDNSQDGTDRICKELADLYPVRLITRTGDRGLASAVLHGIRESRSRFVLVMDADLSHPPEDIPRLLACLRKGADFVVGSRYVEGGTTDATWGMFRWLNSKVATILALGLTDLKDPMAGFFGFPRAILQGVPPLLPLGYKIALEILVKARCRQVAEIPIAFMERRKGESKLTLHQQLQYLRHLRRLYQFRFPRTAELAHFMVVGSTGMVIDLMFYLLFTHLVGINHQTARGLSFVMAASWNWFLNRWLTFVSGRHKPPGKQWVEFLAAASLGFSVNWGSYKLLTDHSPYFMHNHLAGFFVGICMGMLFNYTVSRIFVFRPFALPISTTGSGLNTSQNSDAKQRNKGDAKRDPTMVYDQSAAKPIE